MEKFDFDVAIIGGGSAGYATARTTSAAGKRTVVIDGSEALGGLCILRGCMPTKALLHAADVRFQSKRSNIWGIDSGEIGFDFGKVMQRKVDMVEEFASYRRDQLQDGRFKLIRGTAQFCDPHTLDINNGELITAKQIMISTGSRVADLPLPELSNLGCITSDDALELKSLPKSIIVLGGGAVALEFAQFFARFDVEVTVLQRSPHVLSDFDEDSGIEIEAALRNEGITVHTDCKISAARNEGETKVVVFEQAKKILEVQAEMVFHGLGRSSNTETLSLENSGAETER